MAGTASSGQQAAAYLGCLYTSVALTINLFLSLIISSICTSTAAQADVGNSVNLAHRNTEEEHAGRDWQRLDSALNKIGHPGSGTLLTARLALQYGLACNTAGGTHHAFPAAGSGFCILNDLAITAAALMREGAVQRVLVLDLDVHQVHDQWLLLEHLS